MVLPYCPDDDGTCSKSGDDLRNLLDDIENLPSAQPEPKTGWWDDIGGVFRYGCPFCHHAYQFSSNYCPNCGERLKIRAREIPKDVDLVKFGEKICKDFRNGIPIAVEGVKGEEHGQNT